MYSIDGKISTSNQNGIRRVRRISSMIFPLLMTASVNPRGMSGLSVNDITEREGQYLGTLQFYLQHEAISEIVFIENSGHDLAAFKSLAAVFPQKRVEFISCDLNGYPREYGKSYGELLTLDYAAEHSTRVTEAGGYFKVTGRFPILNIGKLLAEAQRRQPWELFCDNKDHPIYDWLHNGWTGHACDTRFFGVTLEFYRRHFLGRASELDDSQNRLIEFMFFETARKAVSGCSVIRRFKTEPEYAGKAGHIQTALLQVNNYSGFVAKVKRRIRQLGRWIAPWFWF